MVPTETPCSNAASIAEQLPSRMLITSDSHNTDDGFASPSSGTFLDSRNISCIFSLASPQDRCSGFMHAGLDPVGHLCRHETDLTGRSID